MRSILRHGADAVGQEPDAALAAVLRVVPGSLVQTVVAAHRRPKQRQRKLPLALLVLLVLAMSVYTQEALAVVFLRVVAGRRAVAPDPAAGLVSRSARCQGRGRLGARPLVALFHAVARPLAGPQTPGAWLWGLRLVALDGTKEVVPDSPANARAFGRPSGKRGEGAYPQVQGIYVVEVGTHAVLDAGFWPCHTSEHPCGRRLLRALAADMLLLYDNGFHSFDLVHGVRTRHAHLLGSLPATVQIHRPLPLPDGSVWGWLRPSDPARRRAGERVRVRIITYRLTDPARPHCGQVRRLVTRLLDPQAYPALDLVCAYHERWAVELTIDEIDTQQRLAQQPLRSQTPVGVLQELYGLLIVHYALRALMVQAAATRGVDPDRLSFTRTVQLVAATLPAFQLTPSSAHPTLYARLLRDGARHLLPRRANRSNPRVIKRQQSTFPRKRAHHCGVPPLRLPFRDAFALLAPLP